MECKAFAPIYNIPTNWENKKAEASEAALSFQNLIALYDNAKLHTFCFKAVIIKSACVLSIVTAIVRLDERFSMNFPFFFEDKYLNVGPVLLFWYVLQPRDFKCLSSEGRKFVPVLKIVRSFNDRLQQIITPDKFISKQDEEKKNDSTTESKESFKGTIQHEVTALYEELTNLDYSKGTTDQVLTKLLSESELKELDGTKTKNLVFAGMLADRRWCKNGTILELSLTSSYQWLIDYFARKIPAHLREALKPTNKHTGILGMESLCGTHGITDLIKSKAPHIIGGDLIFFQRARQEK